MTNDHRAWPPGWGSAFEPAARDIDEAVARRFIWEPGDVVVTRIDVIRARAALAAGSRGFIEAKALPRLLDALGNMPPCNLANLRVRGRGNEGMFGGRVPVPPSESMPGPRGSLERLREISDALARGRIHTELLRVDPRSLTMTQTALNSVKVAEIFDAIRREGWHERTYVLSETYGHVLDGNHRWTAAAAYRSTGAQFELPIVKIGTDLEQLSALLSDRNPGKAESTVQEPPDVNDPWLYLWNLDEWVLIATDTADGVPSSLDELQPFVPDGEATRRRRHAK